MKHRLFFLITIMVFPGYAWAQPDTLDPFERFEQNQENTFQGLEDEQDRMFRKFKEREILWHEITTGKKVSDYSEIAEESLAAEKADPHGKVQEDVPKPRDEAQEEEPGPEPEKEGHGEGQEQEKAPAGEKPKEEGEKPEEVPLGPQEVEATVPHGNPLKKYVRVSSEFGYRNHPVHKKKSFHPGIDIAAQKGRKIYATANGVVLRADEFSSYGNYVLLQHGKGYRTAYAHCTRVLVKKGQKVKRGDVIALVGSTGLSTGDHLHYEVIRGKKKVNPRDYF